MLSHCPRSSNRYSCKNFALNDLHSSRARGIAIVEAVQMEQPVDYVQAQLPLESVSESSGVRRALSAPTKISPCWKVITSVGPDSFMNCRCNDAIFRSETIKTEISRSWTRSLFFLRGKRRQSSAAFRANISRSTTSTGTLCWRLRTVISGIGAIASLIGLSELDRLNRSSFSLRPGCDRVS